MAREVNFDGLVGATHNYAGLAFGNVASMTHAGKVANPRAAALEGLAKMKALHDVGIPQGVIPPQERPHLPTLRAMGFRGGDTEVLKAALSHSPTMLAMACSAAAMWTANAATVSPSADTADGRVHFTPANLQTKLHRCIEAEQTTRTLRAIFRDESRFDVHEPLPRAPVLGDEGAANHTRLCLGHGSPGVEIFTWGREATANHERMTSNKYPARQSREASALIAHSHGLEPGRTQLVQQSPEAIDHGVFHNDVICVGNEHVLLIHEKAWVDQNSELEWLDAQLNGNLCTIEVPADRVSLKDAVSTYLFNSQIVSTPDGRMMLICAEQCRTHEEVWRFIQDDVVGTASNPISEVRTFNLTQSMHNGGGPACLRLRVVVGEDEFAAINPRCIFSEDLYTDLVDWVERHYRDILAIADLADPTLLEEVRAGLDELTDILDLGAIYPFQR